MRKIKKPDSLQGGCGRNSPVQIMPYLPDSEGFFDSRHWTWGGVNEALPFSLTTRVSSNNQQYLKLMEKETKYRIRKLTPKECFRLMGVDDEAIDKIQESGLSNSAQYKLAGNSIVVDVLYHIFNKLLIETQPHFQAGDQLTLF